MVNAVCPLVKAVKTCDMGDARPGPLHWSCAPWPHAETLPWLGAVGSACHVHGYDWRMMPELSIA